MGVYGAAAGAVLCLLLCRGIVRSQDPASLPYAAPESCGEIFQSGNLSCVSCAENSMPSEDGFFCVCAAGSVRGAGDASSTPQCSPCAQSLVPSQDGVRCLQCAPPLVYDPSSLSCSPCNSSLYVYLDTPPSSPGSHGNRECFPCPPGTWADQSGFSCVECGIENCSQCMESTTHNGLCFPASLSLPSPPAAPDSFPYYDQHFTAGVGLCRYGNQEACQLIVNLCTLQSYSRSDEACIEALSSTSPLLPSLFYSERGADEALATTIGTKFYTSESTKGPHRLPLVLALYSLHGAFLGLRNLTDEILVCRDLPPRYEAAWRVGVRYEVECSVGVASLSEDSQEPIFYDLYLHDQSSGSDLLRPVPVLPDDYVDGESGERVNVGEVRGEWQLVTRFFLREGLTFDPRYARNIVLRVEVDSGGRVFMPFLRIDYATWEPDPDSTRSRMVTFSVRYSQDVASFNIAVSVCVVVMAALVGVVCGLHVNGFLRRSGELCCTLPTYVFMLAEFSGLLSSALFVLLSVSCTVILILYKGQTLFVYTLPVGSQLLVFRILLPVALLCRAVHAGYLVWSQCSVDIFLIDWEKPKGVLASTNQNAEQLSPVPPTQLAPVSIWRTYFVANEWNKLQSVRRGFPLLQLVLALLLLQVTGLRHLAEQDPTGYVTTSSRRYSAPHSPLLRFSLSTLVLTTLAVAMRLYMFLVYERFLEHKIHQFVDLCSVSNVSVFIMWRRCYGYYIEGRSVHGRADTCMREMNSDLHREREDMCGRRGLLPDSDLQTFQIALTQQFRTRYDKVFSPLQAEIVEGQGQAVRGGAREGMPRPPQGGLPEASIAAYEHMNRFLSAFISHNLRDVEFTTKAKVFVERVLDLELHSPEDRCLFYEDPAATFSRLLFYGQEWSLWQLEVLVFAFVDMLATDYVLAAVVAILAAWIVSGLRDAFGRRNLKRKTLVDERFLI